MRLYPELTRPRARQVAIDLVVAGLLVLFAVVARAVHGAVQDLTAISRGFTDNAQGAHGAWSSAAQALGGIPLIGDRIGGALQDLADSTVGDAAATGREVTDAITAAADVLGLAALVVPTALVLLAWLPRRIDRARRWDAAARVLGAAMVPGAVGAPQAPGGAHPSGGVHPDSGPPLDGIPGEPPEFHDTLVLPRPQGRPMRPVAPPAHLLAMRALCDVPFEDLVPFAPRPFEAYEAGDYEPLVDALYAHAGMRRPG